MDALNVTIGAQTVLPQSVVAKDSLARLIINPAAGSTAAFMGSLIAAARKRGIQAHVLEPGGTRGAQPSGQRRKAPSR